MEILSLLIRVVFFTPIMNIVSGNNNYLRNISQKPHVNGAEYGQKWSVNCKIQHTSTE